MRLLVATLFVCALAAYAWADPAGDVVSAQRELSRVDGERAQLDGRRVRLEGESRDLATQIEKLKASSESIRRDAQLQELLAASKAKSDELERVAGELRARTTVVQNQRRTLIGACDRALAGPLADAKRLELARLRTAQVTQLATTTAPLGVSRADAGALDGPRELKEKADLLRDSGDKLKREVKRLAMRIDDVERRRHLRERAGAVDEDFFGESISNRHVARAAGSSSLSTAGAASPAQGRGGAPQQPAGGTTGNGDQAGGAAGAPAPGGGGAGGTNGAGGGGGVNTPTAGFAGPTGSAGGSAGTSGFGDSSTTTVLRNLVDPATLDELRRADSSDDLERQVRALRRAQGELEGLAAELDRRAQTLSRRADELKNKK
jgi:hypothetical protein